VKGSGWWGRVIVYSEGFADQFVIGLARPLVMHESSAKKKKERGTHTSRRGKKPDQTAVAVVCKCPIASCWKRSLSREPKVKREILESDGIK
jgi:hypothetical protein